LLRHLATDEDLKQTRKSIPSRARIDLHGGGEKDKWRRFLSTFNYRALVINISQVATALLAKGEKCKINSLGRPLLT